MTTAPDFASQLPPEPTPATHALCPDHPDRPAETTCNRCGRFVCAECQGGPGGACPSCLQQQLAALPSLSGRGRIASTLLYVTAGTELMLSLASLLTAGEEENLAVAIAVGLLGIGLLAVYITTVVFFLRWLHLSVRTANALGHDIGVTPGWAVGWWFIPFANLVKPYHTVRGVLSALGGERAVHSAKVGLWWTCWLGGNILSNVSTRMDGMSDLAPAIGLVASVVSTFAAVLAVGVIRTVNATVQR